MHSNFVREVMLQMDFAEDYRCPNTDEVQNAYFGSANVTIFPVVAYYVPETSDDLSVQSFAIISDQENHDAIAVLCVPDYRYPRKRIRIQLL